MPAPTAEPIWKAWLDRLLVLDVFLVLAGAVWFAVGIVANSQGIEGPLRLFQQLWDPLFTPAIGVLIASALVSGLTSWWRRRGPRTDRDSGT